MFTELFDLSMQLIRAVPRGFTRCFTKTVDNSSTKVANMLIQDITYKLPLFHMSSKSVQPFLRNK